MKYSKILFTKKTGNRRIKLNCFLIRRFPVFLSPGLIFLSSIQTNPVNSPSGTKPHTPPDYWDIPGFPAEACLLYTSLLYLCRLFSLWEKSPGDDLLWKLQPPSDDSDSVRWTAAFSHSGYRQFNSHHPEYRPVQNGRKRSRPAHYCRYDRPELYGYDQDVYKRQPQTEGEENPGSHQQKNQGIIP